jgi:hypothetical protein
MPPKSNKQHQQHLKEFCEKQGIPNVNLEGTMADLPATLIVTLLDSVHTLQTKVTEMQVKITSLNSRVSAVESIKNALEAHIKVEAEERAKILRRLEHSEAEVRRRSIIIGGLNCGKLSCAKVVKSFFQETLKTQLNFVSAFPVSKSSPDADKAKTSLIKVILRDSSDKAVLFGSAKLLKGTDQYIREDLTKDERQNRQALIKLMNNYREKGKEASVRGKILTVDGNSYHFKNGKLCSYGLSDSPMET